MNTVKRIFPFVILFSLLGMLWYELFHAKPSEIPSALIGESVPAFMLPALNTKSSFTDKQLQGQTILLNVWATWCAACALEHPMLMKIKAKYHVPLYSLLYKDDRVKASQWLVTQGNPYELSGDDSKGDTAIDLGVYGTPETFVISPSGKIVYRHVGIIDQATWDKTLWPLIQRLNEKSRHA